MSVAALKLTDFNQEGGTSLAMMTKPLGFKPRQTDDTCESCQAAGQNLAALEASYAENLAAQMEALQSGFESELHKVREALEVKIQTGLFECLSALFPALAEASLRKGLQDELQRSLMETLPESLSVRISSTLENTIELPDGISLTPDPNLAGHKAEIRQGDARTLLDPDAILNACLAVLKSNTVEEIHE